MSCSSPFRRDSIETVRCIAETPDLDRRARVEARHRACRAAAASGMLVVTVSSKVAADEYGADVALVLRHVCGEPGLSDVGLVKNRLGPKANDPQAKINVVSPRGGGMPS